MAKLTHQAITFHCPCSLDKRVLKLAKQNMLERTDIIISAAELLLQYLEEGNDPFQQIEDNTDKLTQEIDFSQFDEDLLANQHLDEEEKEEDTDLHMPWD